MFAVVDPESNKGLSLLYRSPLFGFSAVSRFYCFFEVTVKSQNFVSYLVEEEWPRLGARVCSWMVLLRVHNDYSRKCSAYRHYRETNEQYVEVFLGPIKMGIRKKTLEKLQNFRHMAFKKYPKLSLFVGTAKYTLDCLIVFQHKSVNPYGVPSNNPVRGPRRWIRFFTLFIEKKRERIHLKKKRESAFAHGTPHGLSCDSLGVDDFQGKLRLTRIKILSQTLRLRVDQESHFSI